MIKRALKREFDSGRAPLYVMAATPVALMAGFILPPPFAPALSAFFFFPVFFYYTRREAYGKLFSLSVFWIFIHFTLVMGASAIATAPSGPPMEQDWVYFIRSGFEAFDPARSIAALIYSCMLSVVSGGVLFLFRTAMVVSHAAQTAGSFLNEGKDMSVLLSPARLLALARGAGHLMAGMGLSTVFYMKLESRPVVWDGPAKVIITGVAIVLASIFLEMVFAPNQNPVFSA
ncbi:MAG: hypothetical protein HY751_06820 [Nitrospinae bacterium]|nr:hypothetical protein [Nitrospinota bacterium]